MLRLIWNLSIHIRTFLRVWMPTNILLDALRTRRGLHWGAPAMLLSIWTVPALVEGGAYSAGS